MTPIKNGFVQDTYADFMGKAANGMLAMASDINLVDGVFVGDVEKAYAGRCYALKDGTLSALTADDEPCVVVLNYAMRSDTDGNYSENVATVLRSARVGGRIWVEVTATGTTITSATKLHVATTGAFTDAESGVDVSAKIKVVGTYTVADSKALCLVEVL